MNYLNDNRQLNLIIYKYFIVNLMVNIVSGILQNPCPGLFKYQYDNQNNLSGLIQIFVLNDYYDIIRLDVELSVEGFGEDYNGDLELLNPLSEVTQDLQQNKPLNYKLYFPAWRKTPPAVTKILLNGKQICSGNSVDNNMVLSTINLWHNLTIPITFKPKLRKKIKRSANTSSRDPSKIFASNPFLNQNYQRNSIVDPCINNNQNVLGGDTYGSTARPATFTNINSEYKPNFQNNPFLSNHKPQNTQTNAPYFSNTQQNYPKQTTEKYLPSFQSNPFLSGYINNQESSTSNRPFQNNPFFSNYVVISPSKKNTPEATTIEPKQQLIPVVEVKYQADTTVNKPTHNFNVAPNPRPFSGDCGISVNPNMLIMGGRPTNKTTYPWLTALFLQNNEGLKFICRSTLISKKHVITAAHCVRNRNRKFKPEELWIIMGRNNIRIWSNDGAQTVQAESTHVHPDYKIKSADADVAVVVLSEEAIFSNLIRPACLWTGERNVNLIVKKSGTVIGWGKDEFGNPLSAEPRVIEFPVVSGEDCIWSNKAFREITSNRTFCAGNKNNSGPCNGDSGGGFLMQINNRWTLRGIVSMSLLRETDGNCDLEQYVVFTDTAQFMDWVLSIL